jgi:hypothetical protein
MKHFMIAAMVLLSLLAMPSLGRAISIPMGADTLFEQAERSSIVASARFRSRDARTLVFDRDTVFSGSVSPTITVESDGFVESRELRTGALYVLFLEPASDGAVRFSASVYSIVEPSEAETPAALDAIRVFLRDRGDSSRLRASLLQLAAADSPMLQVSALTTLANRQLVTPAAAAQLLQMVSSGQLRQLRAREIVMHQAGWLRVSDFRGSIETRLMDSAESPLVREAALLALSRIDPSRLPVVAARLESAPELRSRALALQAR